MITLWSQTPLKVSRPLQGHHCARPNGCFCVVTFSRNKFVSPQGPTSLPNEPSTEDRTAAEQTQSPRTDYMILTVTFQFLYQLRYNPTTRDQVEPPPMAKGVLDPNSSVPGFPACPRSRSCSSNFLGTTWPVQETFPPAGLNAQAADCKKLGLCIKRRTWLSPCRFLERKLTLMRNVDKA